MAKNFVGENTLTYLVTLIQNALSGKLDRTDLVNNLTSADSDKALSAAQGKVLADQIASAGAGNAAQVIAAQKGQANGLAPLGEDQKISSVYLPSYVDDVVEGYLQEGVFYEDEAHTNALTGESGKIYVDLTTNHSYRWTGSAYIVIASGDMVEIGNTKVQEIWDAAV